MDWNSRTIRQFIIVCLLLGFGSTYLIIDYSSIPNEDSLMWMGEFKYITDRSYGDPQKAFKIGLGDGFISNIEMIFTHLALIFGCFELIDFAFCFEPKRNINIKSYFRKIINRMKDNIDKETK